MTNAIRNPDAAALPEIHRTEIDGVPVFWSARQGRLNASLIFGVGLAHENFLNTGITHLIEHLAMRSIRTERYENNASTEILHTSFEVASNPETVAKHLLGLCEALSNLDLDPLELEKKVISAEEKNNDGLSIVEWLPAKLWFGNTSFGLMNNTQVAPVTVGADQVRSWSARYFHRNNAALILSGPPPAGLKLPLPEGDRAHPPQAAPFDISTPSWSSIPNGVAGNALVPWTAEMASALAILDSRLMETLRHRDGLVYDIAANHQMIDSQRALVSFGADVPDDKATQVVEVIQTALMELANTGPTKDELAIDRERFIEQLAEPDFAEYHAFDAAMTELTGWVSVVEHHQKLLAGLRKEDVAAAAKNLASQLVLCTPDEKPVGGLTELAGTALLPAVTGKQAKRVLFGSSVPKKYRLIIGEEGLTAFYGDSDSPIAVIRYNDIAGVGLETETGEEEPILHLHAIHGGSIILRAADWRGGVGLVRAVRQNIDPSLCFKAPELMRLLVTD